MIASVVSLYFTSLTGNRPRNLVGFDGTVVSQNPNEVKRVARLCNEYLIAVGSNLGHRENNLQKAAHHLIQATCEIVEYASVYETEPVGAADQMFLNTAWRVRSYLGPHNFLRLLLNTERLMGRERTVKWGNRVIDLDILLWRSPQMQSSEPTRIWESMDLQIPHPRMLERDFMLLPAAELAPDWVHPETGRTLLEEVAARDYDLSALEVRVPLTPPLSAPMETLACVGK